MDSHYQLTNINKEYNAIIFIDTTQALQYIKHIKHIKRPSTRKKKTKRRNPKRNY